MGCTLKRVHEKMPRIDGEEVIYGLSLDNIKKTVQGFRVTKKNFVSHPFSPSIQGLNWHSSPFPMAMHFHGSH